MNTDHYPAHHGYHNPARARVGAVDVTVPHLDLSAMTRALQNLAPAVQQFATGLGEALDTMRYRVLVANLMRTRTYEEATALVELRRARYIRDGRRRHGMVKHRRDALRAARKAATRG